MGSVFAVIAARTGFGRFILADGDTVELSNLNRQAFNSDHLGMNKARATQDILQKINPDVETEVIESYLERETLGDPITRSDIVVNTIDYEHPAFLDCCHQARFHKRPSLLPINLGWGGAIFVFTPESPTFEETVGLIPGRPYPVAQIKQAVASRAMKARPPRYALDVLSLLQNNTPASWPYDPQLAVGVAVTASLLVQAALSLVRQDNIRTAPYPIHIDFFDLIRESDSTCDE